MRAVLEGEDTDKAARLLSWTNWEIIEISFQDMNASDTA